MSLKFGPTVRLRTRAEYVVVQERGRRIVTRHFTVLAHPNTVDRDRLGVIASRRAGGAVLRNRLKRRVRELFRLRDDGMSVRREGLDIVVIPRREVAVAPFSTIEREFRQALVKLHSGRRT